MGSCNPAFQVEQTIVCLIVRQLLEVHGSQLLLIALDDRFVFSHILELIASRNGIVVLLLEGRNKYGDIAVFQRDDGFLHIVDAHRQYPASLVGIKLILIGVLVVIARA